MFCGDLNKKRKLQDEQFELPLPTKHKFRGRSSSSQQKFTDDEGSGEHMESVTDSNSFNESSMYPEDIFELEYLKANACDHPSTSTSSCSSQNFRNTLCTLNRISIKKIRNRVELNPVNLKVDLQLSENNEIEQWSGVGLEDMMMPDPNEVNPKTYILSSGRWSINKDTRLSTKKPTIDKEFEQYFSMLML